MCDKRDSFLQNENIIDIFGDRADRTIGKRLVLAAPGAGDEAYFCNSSVISRDYVVADVYSVGVALLTISYRSIRAALNNPAECLRYE